MEISTLNEHVMKIIIAAHKEDSIRAISKRIGLSYGWTYKWTIELINLGVFKKEGLKLLINKKNKFYISTLRYLKSSLSSNIGAYYSVLSLFGIKYCFTKTDAVFVWTNGGYNISRSSEHYPIFIKIIKKDYQTFLDYCKKLGLYVKSKRGVFYSVEILVDFDVDYCRKIPADSLDETIKFMKKYIYNFQPALEMIRNSYGKNLKIKYREAEYV